MLIQIYNTKVERYFMKSFSQRKGIKPIKNVIQIDSMDNDLRNKLWNALESQLNNLYHDAFTETFPEKIWHDYYKQPIDIMPDSWRETKAEIRQYFFTCQWFEAYDFIEFIINLYPDFSCNQTFMEICNCTFKEEMSAYQFVGGTITQITGEEEIAEIEKALKIPISPVQQHIKRSLELLSDKKDPDYRNSIKESISAVESICKLIANNNKATLTNAIETIEKGRKIKMHPALGRAFKELYFYTNSAEGIRHGLSDEPNLDLEDAKFMLVSCSAFINYLMVKSSKAGIKYLSEK